MVDQPAGESVTSNDAQSVAGITPDQLNQPQSPEVSQDQALLQQKLALSNKHTKEAERKAAEAAKQTAALQEQVKALTEQIQQTNTSSLEGQGRFEDLWKEAQKTIASLKADLEAERQSKQSVAAEFEQERLKVQAMDIINGAGALSPSQMFNLLQVEHGLRKSEDGQVEVVVGGASISLTDHLNNLRNSADSGYQHHFSPSGAVGMGAAPSASVAPGQSNPWKTGNFTEQLMLQSQNPELAAALQAEAGRG
jgi:hypothetical protein